jgi:transcriptional regulator with XRE-family HTH domain
VKLGENIKKLRELKNYTQQYLADELGMSLSGYGKIERDQTEITVNRLFEIIRILEVDLFTLLNFNGNDVFKNGKNSSNQSPRPESQNQTHSQDWANQMIQKYKEENDYLKGLIQQLLEKRGE